MRKIEVTLKSPGDITQLPDSQKMFGGLMSLFSKEYGNDLTTELVNEVYACEAKIMISSVFPKGYLPLPMEYIMELLNKNEGINKNLKELYEELKKINFVKEGLLIDFLSKVLRENDCTKVSEYLEMFRKKIKEDYVKVKYYPQQRVGIGNEVDGIPAVENSLYSTPKVNITQEKQGSEKIKVKEYMFWIIVDDEKISERVKELLNVIEKGCTKGDLIILGRRVTQGSNIYKLDKYKSEKMEDKKSNYGINLGKLIPDEFNYKKSYLDLFTSERKPYNNNLILDKSWHDKCFISFINEGSIICKPSELSIFSVSKSIKNPFNDDTIVFGNSLLYMF